MNILETYIKLKLMEEVAGLALGAIAAVVVTVPAVGVIVGAIRRIRK